MVRLLPVANGLGGVGVVGVERRVVEVTDALEPCALGEGLGPRLPAVGQLPVEAVVGDQEQGLALAVGRVRDEAHVASAQVHVGEHGQGVGVGLEGSAGADLVGLLARRDRVALRRDLHVAQAALDRPARVANPDRDPIALGLASGHVVNLQHEHGVLGDQVALALVKAHGAAPGGPAR